MKKIRQVLSLFTLTAMLGGMPTSAVAADINIIPVPVKTQRLSGEFILPQKVAITLLRERLLPSILPIS